MEMTSAKWRAMISLKAFEAAHAKTVVERDRLKEERRELSEKYKTWLKKQNDI